MCLKKLVVFHLFDMVFDSFDYDRIKQHVLIYKESMVDAINPHYQMSI